MPEPMIPEAVDANDAHSPTSSRWRASRSWVLGPLFLSVLTLFPAAVISVALTVVAFVMTYFVDRGRQRQNRRLVLAWAVVSLSALLIMFSLWGSSPGWHHAINPS